MSVRLPSLPLLPVEAGHVTLTERLQLRPPRPDDLPALHEALTDPANQRFGALGAAAPERLAGWLAHWVAQGFGPWAVELRDDPAPGVLGFGGLLREPRGGMPALWLEFHFRSQFWGQGYAAEMSQAALDLGFGPLQAGAVQALVLPGNAPARRTLERLGLRLKGSLADQPGQAPSLLHGLSAIEFAARPRQAPEPTAFGA